MSGAWAGGDLGDIGQSVQRTLELIVEGVIEFAGFEVAALSLVEGDDLWVATVLGDDDAVRRLHGARVPLAPVLRELESAEEWGSLRFLREERAPVQQPAWFWASDRAPLDLPDAWQRLDRLNGLLCDDDGQLRGMLSVDLPSQGRRPDEAQLHTLQMYVRLAERALVTELERNDIEEKIEHEHVLAEYRRKMIGALSDEVSGAVTGISTALSSLHIRRTDGDAIGVALDVMNRGLGRVRFVVDDMAALSKLEQADREPPTRRVDLRRVVLDSVALHSASASMLDVEIVVDAGAESLVMGDHEELGHLVSNLVSNAVKYSEPEGRVLVTLATKPGEDATGAGDTIVLTVSDQGIGIAADDVAHVFEEFFRSSLWEVRARQGTGLGLAIAHHVVRQHRGTIGVESVLGEGSTFTVELPALPRSSDAP